MGDMLATTMRAVLVLLILSLTPARAALTVCNKAEKPVRVAVGFFTGKDWASRGWWTIVPKACAAVIGTALDARYYYVFASDGGAGTWEGNRGFCVAQRPRFDISGRKDCAARGFDRKSFFEIDTGKLSDYTKSLSD